MLRTSLIARSWFLAAIPLAAVVVFAGPRASVEPSSVAIAGDTTVVYGPLRHFAGNVRVEQLDLAVDPTRRYTLRVRNGAPDGSSRVTGGRVAFDNWTVLSSNELGTAQYEWDRVVRPRGGDTLVIDVTGPSGSYVTIDVVETTDASYAVFGPERFTRDAGRPEVYTRSFNVTAADAAPYRLCLLNGNADGTQRLSNVTIRLNGTEVVSPAQVFSGSVASLVRDVSLVQGSNALDITLPSQRTGFINLCVTATDVTPPVLTIAAPAPGFATRDTQVTVSGTVEDQTTTRVTVNGQPATRSGRAYSAIVALVSDGPKTIHVAATDGAGLTTDSARSVIRDTRQPRLTVDAPADRSSTNDANAIVSGSATDLTAVTVNANGVPLRVDSVGRFAGAVPLANGPTMITVTATDAVGNQAVVVRTIRRDPGRTNLAMSGGGSGFSCLNQGGPLVTLSGTQTQSYFHVNLADSTKIDARMAHWANINFPSRIGGGVNLCWSGGELRDSFPPSTAWSQASSRYGHFVETTSATDLEDIRIFNYGYGVSEEPAGPNWSVRRTLVRYSRATCVNNPYYHSGTIEDSFLDGCWRGVGSKESSTLGDSSANLVVIRNSLIRLQAIDGSFYSNVPNQSAFWEYTVKGPRISLINNVFRADAHSREGQANRMYMAPPPGKLAECSGNIMVWLGKGAFPETLPACFTLTTNVAVWDSAVAVWNAAYPPVLPDASAPIVSMFQPGVVGGTILTGTVTLIATAVDDRSVAGVQLQLDGQDIGLEQTSPTPYIGADSLLNRDFTTKYQIEWNSTSVPNGTHTLRARARDAAGHSTTSAAVNVTVGLSPDPATVATPIDPTVGTTTFASTGFLYTGTNPIQTGVASGTINPLRAAVVRGRTLARDGTPLSGVAVSILGRPEFGQTLSRADGRYDLVVNGGGPLTVALNKTGFLSAQRHVDVPWQDYVSVDDAVMIPVDGTVTTIDFANPTEVARGSVVHDTSGTRQGTLIFKQGTQATMILPNGSQQPLTSMNVRVTEYTVGANGPNTMPAPLPPASAYTYAAEFSADEAISAGATSVSFSQAVPFYLENFLNFPVGLAVPMAFYDRTQAAWIPRHNGRVVQIVSVTGGLANLDITGDGVADDATSLGVNDAERQRLALLYTTGQKLWRIPVSHFSPGDPNYPPETTSGQTPPNAAPAAGGGGGGSGGAPGDKQNKKKDNDNPCKTGGSIVECENQTLGETIRVTGTPFALSYRSDRVPGRTASHELTIPLSRDTLPPGLVQIRLQVSVAGQVFEDSFPPQPDLETRFQWDGKDVYGRSVLGIQPVTVRIGYDYQPHYAAPLRGTRVSERRDRARWP